MTFAIFRSDNLEEFDAGSIGGFRSTADSINVESSFVELPRLGEKLRIPKSTSQIQRPRLYEMLEHSAGQYGATLISGRAGTGKTALAADFARRQKRVAWYSIDPTDIEWGVFSHYFSECSRQLLDGRKRPKQRNADADLMQGNVAQFLSDCFPQPKNGKSRVPALIVLDNVHHVFDADWFCDFFNLLIASMLPKTHLLMLCRSRPPAPLWRLRSKQMLNVIDEKLLGFTHEETREFFHVHEMPEQLADLVHKESFGRISKIKQFLGISG
jgi:ATP/maltotriose-dependent transcriptional regulator MalT